MRYFWRCDTAFPAVHRRARSFLCQNRKCSDPALCRGGSWNTTEECGDRPRCADSRRTGSGRGFRTRRQTISPHRARNLPDYPTDDRQAFGMKPIRVLSVASEIYPLIKTGGLADVTGALPKALRAEGIETRTVVPGYPDVLNALGEVDEVLEFKDYYGGPARVLGCSVADLDLFVLDAPHLFARPGNPYTAPDGADWPDNAIRFASLGRIAAEIGQGAIPEFVPHVVHAHDWQAGLTHAFLHYSERPRPGTIMTVHNLAYQGQFPREILNDIGLPPDSFAIDGVEYYGGGGFFKAGAQK